MGPANKDTLKDLRIKFRNEVNLLKWPVVLPGAWMALEELAKEAQLPAKASEVQLLEPAAALRDQLEKVAESVEAEGYHMDWSHKVVENNHQEIQVAWIKL